MQNLRAFTMPRIAGAATISALAVAALAVPGVANAATPHAASPAAASAPAASAPVQSVQPVQSVKSATPSTAAPSTAAKTATPEAKTYTVHSGDTLAGIAGKTLGSANRYTEIFDLNKNKAQNTGGSLTNPDLILPGWVFKLPGADTAKASTGSGSATGTSASTSTSTATQTTKSTASTTTASSATQTTGSYADNLDGWIKQAQAILAANGVNVSYNAIYQTAMHESAGNPSATNGWDSNAAKGTPSIGLMQTIQPTFNAYALAGHHNIYNPVDNIIAAARYAQAVYGGLDNVVAARGGGSNWYGY